MRKERDGSRSVVYKTERTREGRYTRYPLCDYHMTLIRKRLGDSTRFSGSRGTVLADPDHEYDGRFVSSRFLRLVVFERQGGKCGCCGKRLRWDAPPKQWEIDHVVPIFRGGKTRLDHLMALCKKCHDDKTALEKSEVTKARWTAGLRWMTHYEKNLLIDDLLKEIADFKQQVAHLTAQG
jgi:5-methylcytosine-specific restriction endonuclease McrA